MIVGFACAETGRIFRGERSRRLPPEIQQVARRKLAYLNCARVLSDLASPPGNRLAALKGDRRGRYSMRINDQWRLCFAWRQGRAEEVEIVDCH